jgi:hypothetical protein
MGEFFAQTYRPCPTNTRRAARSAVAPLKVDSAEEAEVFRLSS